MSITLLLADDEPLIRVGMRAILEVEDDLTVVAEAATGAEVLPLVRRHRPDVVLMDVRMPDVDGIQATRYVLASVANPPKIVVVTTFENDEYVYDALLAGANGFLLKRSTPQQMVQAVRTVADGDCLLFPNAIRNLAIRHGRRADTFSTILTDREREVLHLITAGLSNIEIATRLQVGLETVKTHVSNVLAKLGARDRVQAVIIAYETGFTTS